MGKKPKKGKKCMWLAVLLISCVFAIPAFALNDLTNEQEQNQVANGGRSDADANALSASRSEAAAVQGQEQGQLQGQAQGQGQGQGQIAAQGQGQLGIVSPSQSSEVNVGGDEQKTTTYVMQAPNTVAGDGQTAMSAFSLFGGVNVAESAEYKVCIEKVRLLSQMEASGLMSLADAQKKAARVYAELDEATAPRRWLWIGPKTRGKHAGNLLGLLATDPCEEINTDNWMGTKDWFVKK